MVAFPSALVFGRLSGQYPSGTLIPVCIAAYAGIALFAFFLKHQWQFWVLAVVVGMFQGGIQALSRSHFAKIIPPEKSGEYFGLFDICGKGASFLGTMIVSVGSQLTGSANVGVGSLIVLFIVGFVLFRVSVKSKNNPLSQSLRLCQLPEGEPFSCPRKLAHPLRQRWRAATSPEGRGLGSDCKVCGFVRSSPLRGSWREAPERVRTLTFFLFVASYRKAWYNRAKHFAKNMTSKGETT